MSEELMKTIYHVVRIDSDDSFLPTTKNIIYTGEKEDAQEIFSKIITESQESDEYALVCDIRIVKVLAKQRGIINNASR